MTDNNKPMDAETKNDAETQETHAVRIADDVVATIAGLAASEVEGVAGMSGGVAGGIAELLGRKNLTKGVKVEVTDEAVIIDLYMVVKFGSKIPEVAKNVQENVGKSVETMTGLKASAVNVHVQGIAFEDAEENKKEDEKTNKE